MSLFQTLPIPSLIVDTNYHCSKDGIPMKFDPQNRSFTICCEINAFQKSGARIISNRSMNKQNGFELVVPRRWKDNISVCISGKHCDVSETKLNYNQWYHVAVVIKKLYPKTKCEAYLNGKLDGSLEFDSYKSLSTNNQCLMGSWNGYLGHYFKGEIRNLQIYYLPLDSCKIRNIAFRNGYFTFKEDIHLLITILLNKRNWNILNVPMPLLQIIVPYLLISEEKQNTKQ